MDTKPFANNSWNSKHKKPKKKSDLLFWILALLAVGGIVVSAVLFIRYQQKKDERKSFTSRLVITEKDNEHLKNKLAKWTPAQIILLNERNQIKKEKLRKKLEENVYNLSAIGKEILLDKLNDVGNHPVNPDKWKVGKDYQWLEKIESAMVPFEKTKRQYETQAIWRNNSFQTERTKIINKLNPLLKTFYNNFCEKELTPQEKSQKREIQIEPERVAGRITTPTTRQADIDYIKTRFADQLRPDHIEFSGFTGFTGEAEENKDSKETVTMGLTTSTAAHERSSSDKTTIFYQTGNRTIRITLKEELFFNRQGDYDRWISDLKKNDNGNDTWTNFDISWEEVAETIAHELAHAIVNTLRAHYPGIDKGGHGDLHDDFTLRMKNMIESSAEWENFKTWWNQLK